MGVDEELEQVEDGAETEAEQLDEATEVEDAEEVALADSDEDADFELVELELDEDDIVRYLEDDDGNRIGFVLMEGDQEAEYYYVDDEETASEEEENEFDLGITKEGVAQATSDVNAIYKDGIAVAAELKGAFDDIKSAFDFGSILKK